MLASACAWLRDGWMAQLGMSRGTQSERMSRWTADSSGVTFPLNHFNGGQVELIPSPR